MEPVLKWTRLGDQSRRLNNLFALSAATSVDANCRPINLPLPQAPSYVAAHGQILHRIWGANQGAQSSINYLLYDEHDALNRQAVASSIPVWVTTAVRQTLYANHQFMRELKLAHDFLEIPEGRIVLGVDVAAGDVGALMAFPQPNKSGPRHIIFWTENTVDYPENINSLSPYWEPLRWPLLFPYGELGYSPPENNELRQPRTFYY